MSRRRDLEQRRHSLSEIREIMNSMKSLAYMETRKLARFIDAQRDVVASIEVAASDLLHFYPEVLPEVSDQPVSVYLLIGSERGFCGDFNRALIEQLASIVSEQNVSAPIVIAIGNKLLSLMEADPRLSCRLEGASTVEEIPALLMQLVEQLTRLESDNPGLELHALFHDSSESVAVKRVIPPFASIMASTPSSESASPAFPPLINLSPSKLFAAFCEHYLFALLHQMLFTSLYEENHYRVTHMEGAVKHLDETYAHLTQRANALRQEEITEEIEVILLNAADLAVNRRSRYRAECDKS